MRKSKIDQTSATEFSIGVPVSARRRRASTALTDFAFRVTTDARDERPY